MGLYNIKNWYLAVPFVLLATVLLPVVTFASPDSQQGDSEETRWFQIELIIFAHKSDDPLESEKWPEIAGLSLPPGIIDLSLPGTTPPAEAGTSATTTEQPLVFQPVTSPTTTNNTPEDSVGINELIPPVPMPVAYEMLRPEELDLNDVYKKLARSSRFEPLLHVAWKQPTYDKDKAQTVFLYDGMTKSASESEAGPQSDEKQTETDSKAANFSGDALEMGPISPRVAGTVSLSVSRYLHFDADLIYRTPVKQQQAIVIPDLELWDEKPYPTLSPHQGPAYRLEEWNAIRGFRLQESRRMRSKKIHYLDNPFFGIIVLVTPVELPKPPEEPAANTEGIPMPSTQQKDSVGNNSTMH
jgi:hypothetical protein